MSGQAKMNPAYKTAYSGIDHLPDELLLEIITYLVPIRGFKALTEDEVARRSENTRRVRGLHSLTLSCRRINLFTHPYLYQSFIQPYSGIETTIMFLRTILANPSLAENVQYIESLENTEWNSHQPYTHSDDLVCKTLSEARDRLAQQNRFRDVDSMSALLALFHDYSPDDWTAEQGLALIIALVPSVIDLALVKLSRLWRATLASKRYKNSIGLHNLWIYTIPSSGGDRSTGSFIDRECIFPSMPVFGCLWLSSANVYRHHRPWVPDVFCGPPNPAIEEIVFDMCEIHPHFLHTTLLNRSALKRFTCRWGMSSGSFNDIHPVPIDLRQLNSALSKHKSTLESLTLDTLESGWMVSMDQDIPAIGSLRHFTVLKALDVSGLVLWGDQEEPEPEQHSLAHLLPEALERLTIRVEWDEDAVDSLARLLPYRDEMLPNLKSVDGSWRPCTKEYAMLLEQDFVMHGIEIRMQYSDEEDRRYSDGEDHDYSDGDEEHS